MSNSRRYSRDEVALVLRTVAERSLDGNAREDLSRDELEAVIREAGLEVREIDGALAELESSNKRSERALGLRQHAVIRHHIRAELHPELLERARKLINRSVGIVGKSELDAAGLSWFGRHVSVTIEREGEGVSIQVEERFKNTARARLTAGGMFSSPAGMGTFVGLAADGVVEPLALAVGALIPASAYLFVRWTHNRRVSLTEGRLEGLAKELRQLFANETRSLPEPSADEAD